jgi:uncharacterized membrane protein
MNASVAGLVIEVIFFAIGLYVYLFARGLISFGKPEVRARAEEFRKENATWMRLLGLALAAVMLLNIVFHVREMTAG